MPQTFVLSHESPAPQAIGEATVKDGVPVQRFLKKVIPVGKFTKRDRHGKVLWELDVDRPRQEKWVKAFKAMKENGVPVRVRDETGNFSLDLPKASPITTDHAGVFDKDKTRGIKTMVDSIVADTTDLFVDHDGWVTAQVEATGERAIDAIRRGKFTSPEILDCYIDGTSKEYGEVIRAISIVANPLIPGQPEFQTIAASEDSPVYVLSLDNGDDSMKFAPIAALIAAIAGVEVSKVTEDSAPDLLKGIQRRMGEDADKIKALSDESPAPSRGELRAAAKSGTLDLRRMFDAGIVSEAGVKELSALFIGNPDKAEYSNFILSADEPDDAAQMIEKAVDIILKNPGVKKGSKTPLQDPKALSEEESGNPHAPLTPDRVKELLNMTVAGREIVSAATAR